MVNTEKEKFESLWNDFSTLVKGKLITTAQKQSLTTPLAKLILSDAAGAWRDEYSTYGRWLQQLAKNESSKFELIKDVLINDMRFNDVELPSVLPNYCDYLVPTISALTYVCFLTAFCACAGYAISKFWELGTIANAAFVIVPALLTYPAVKQYRKTQTETAVSKTIDSYMNQLEKFKNSILAILS